MIVMISAPRAFRLNRHVNRRRIRKINVQPTVAVVVQQQHAAAHRLHNVFALRRRSVRKLNPRFFRDVDKLRNSFTRTFQATSLPAEVATLAAALPAPPPIRRTAPAPKMNRLTYEEKDSSIFDPRLGNFLRLLGSLSPASKHFRGLTSGSCRIVAGARLKKLKRGKTVKRKWRRHAERSCETRRPDAGNRFLPC